MKARRTLFAVLAAGILVLSACGSNLPSNNAAGTSPSASTSGSAGTGGTGGGAVTIASQNFPEAALVAEMYKELLQNAGYSPTVKLVATRDAYMATFPGSVDIVPEYVGGIVNFLYAKKNGANAQPLTSGDGQQLVKQGKSLLDAQGITLLDLSGATDTNAFFVTKAYSQQNGVTKLSDLTGKSVVLAAAPDCQGRLDCAGGLESKYGIHITKVLPLGIQVDQTYKSVLDGESQLGETTSTDGTLSAQGLVLLQDDKKIQPAQNLVPAVSTDFLTKHPDVAGILNPLMQALTTQNLGEMNAKVSVDRDKPEDVAHEFLTQQGLL